MRFHNKLTYLPGERVQRSSNDWSQHVAGRPVHGRTHQSGRRAGRIQRARRPSLSQLPSTRSDYVTLTSGVTRLQWARVQVFQKGPLFPKKLKKNSVGQILGPPQRWACRCTARLARPIVTPLTLTACYTELWGIRLRAGRYHLAM